MRRVSLCYRPVPSDGNCFFHALAVQVEKRGDKRFTPLGKRPAIAAGLRQHVAARIRAGGVDVPDDGTLQAGMHDDADLLESFYQDWFVTQVLSTIHSEVLLLFTREGGLLFFLRFIYCLYLSTPASKRFFYLYRSFRQHQGPGHDETI